MILVSRAIIPNTGHAAGRILLAEAYREHTGKPMPPIFVTKRGKPYFEGNPLYFSISHTKFHVFVALSERPIGIDAEETGRKINPALTDKILSPGERAQFDAVTDKQAALLKFWVLKEALVKCTGEGLRGYPNHTDFSLDDPRVFVKDGCYLAVIEEDDHVI